MDTQNEIRTIAARERTWEVEALPFRLQVEDGSSPRPVVVLVTAGDAILTANLLPSLAGGALPVAAALEQVIRKVMKATDTKPRRLRVRHADVAFELDRRVRDRGVRAVQDPCMGLSAIAQQMQMEMTGIDVWPPACATDSWSAWGLPEHLTAEVFDAAAAFYERRPWRHVDSHQGPRVTVTDGGEWTVCVLVGRMRNTASHCTRIRMTSPTS